MRLHSLDRYGVCSLTRHDQLTKLDDRTKRDIRPPIHHNTKMKIGFIGLGIMGKPMCHSLLKAGYELVVCSRTQSSVDELIAAGAAPAATPKELAAQVDVVITMLPNSPEVKEDILGPSGVIEGARPGCIVADMSSIAPLTGREIAASLTGKGVEMLDAPVSGGQPKAIEGTLSVMNIMQGLKDDFGDCDHGAIVRHYENQASIELSRPEA